MIFSFNKQHKLSDYIPKDYIDIHSHVLPGIDDGATNIDETKYLLEQMLALGFGQCITSPHTFTHVWDNDRVSIENKFNETIDLLPKQLASFLKSCISEYMIDDFFLERLNNEKLLTLKDNIVLVEMSYLNPTMNLKNVLFEMQMKGYTPLLAHPERYSFYHNSMSNYEELKNIGCLFQLNLLSTVGYYGSPVAKVADYLLKNDLIDHVGSDIHHLKHIEAFQDYVLIKSIKELQEAMQNNSIFKM
jgi:protein-tyrosine phosphatase